jgi:hypothetical protein
MVALTGLQTFLEADECGFHEFNIRYDKLSDIWTKAETEEDLYFVLKLNLAYKSEYKLVLLSTQLLFTPFASDGAISDIHNEPKVTVHIL